MGYPAWHYKSKQSQQKGKGKVTGTSGSAPPKRTYVAVESGSVVFTSKQFEQLMKSLPHFNAQIFNKGGDSDKELDPHFVAGFPQLLGQKTPYEMIMNKKSVYSNLKVFGCLAVASYPNRTPDKMALRGVPCLFLGYPPHQKGYTIFNLLTHTRFVSRGSTPTYFKEAIKDFEWCKAINDEVMTLEENGTWEMTTLPPDKKAIECY
nr:retrovirus-related Pol polyprotein from transposon TNT 1-94 [Tanacetum cinerariifolium]